MNVESGFVLTRQWRDTPAGIELELWLSTHRGPVQLSVPGQRGVFFLPVDQAQQAAELLVDLRGWTRSDVAMRDFNLIAVEAFYFPSRKLLRRACEVLAAHRILPCEADINPVDRFLMERFIRGGLRFRGTLQRGRVCTEEVAAADYQPQLRTVSLDIETAIKGLQLFSIGVYADGPDGSLGKVFMVSATPVTGVSDVFASERELLLGFLQWLEEYDPDIIIGWNVVNFDMWMLEQLCRRHRLQFALGRGGATVHWRELDEDGQRKVMSAPGRVVIDGIELLKTATYQFESFALDYVANQVLGDGKLLASANRGEKITELYHSDKAGLARYNLQDCKLVWDLFVRLRLIDFAVARTRMTGLPMDRIGGSVAAFDFRYLPLLHRQGFVAPNAHLTEAAQPSPGGFVMDSQPGLYRHVLVLDFKSLYPSIIRSFRIDPLALVFGLHAELDQTELVPGFNGAWFARQQAILPRLIEELWDSRDRAKRDGDAALSQAIKILMNSFYGVLGARGCRFFDARLASSITRRGHQIIQQTAAQIESMGWSVIYGDTDSVFVWLETVQSDAEAESVGRQLQSELNRWWTQRLQGEYHIDSALEIEFETHFQHFLMPRIRGSELGSKKRYAGVVTDSRGEQRLVFKGLETVRTDWTVLAREFQAELYRRIFFGLPYREYVTDMARAVLAGEMDARLVYRKRLRRRLEDYQRNIPPHVQAARKAVAGGDLRIQRGDWVAYVMTVNGAEPSVFAELGRASPMDYQHYIDRQLAPVADGILGFVGDSFAALTDQQFSLAF